MTVTQFDLVAVAVFMTPLVIIWAIEGAPPLNFIYRAIAARRAARRGPVIMLTQYHARRENHRDTETRGKKRRR
jgi:hypothetical protein